MIIEFIPTSKYKNLGVMKYENKTPGKPRYYMCFLDKLYLPSIIQSRSNLITHSDYIIMLDEYPDKDYIFIVTDSDMCDDVMIWCNENLREWDYTPFIVKKSRYTSRHDGFIFSTNDIMDAMALKLRWA